MTHLALRTQSGGRLMARNAIGTIERGRHSNGLARRSVSVDEPMALASALGVSPMALLEDPDAP